MAVVSPGAVVEDVGAAGTFTGNEITDTTRAAALAWGTTQQGGSTDGATPPAGVGIWDLGTNLFRRGQCDSLTDWGILQAGVTHALDTGTPAPFSPQSVQQVCDGSVAGQGGQALSATGQAIAAGTNVTSSIYFKGPAGASYKVNTRIVNTDATVTDGAVTTFAATGAWQLLTPAGVAVGVGKTGDTARIIVFENGQRAETFWLAHAMLQKGVSYASPYVATSQGSTALRAAAGVSAPADGLSATTGWAAIRVRMGFAQGAGPSVSPCLFSWDDGTSNNRIQVFWLDPTWATRRVSGGAGGGVASVADTFAIGDTRTVILMWDATKVYLSVAGAAFVSANAAVIPAGLQSTFKIGYAFSLGNNVLDSTVLWFLAGSGSLSNADAAALNALPNVLPAIYPPVGAGTTARWQTYTPVGPKFRRVRVGEPVVVLG